MSVTFAGISQGLNEAIEFVKGKNTKAKVHEIQPVDIKQIREQVNMTQKQFAQMFGISLGTLRHWERGDRKPQGPAMTLLNVIQHSPKVVLEALEH